MSFLHQTTAVEAPRTARQEELLDGLEALVTTEGFRSLTISDLADRLRCSRRTLYELAPGKDDLVALVVGRFLDRNYREGVEAMTAHTTARARLEAFATAVVEDAHRTSLTFADDTFRTPRTATLVANYDQRCVSLIENLIRAGQERGELRDVHPALAAEGLMAAVARVQDNAVLTVLGLTYGEAVTQTLALFLDGLVPGRVDPG